jgi:hypothetical protein
LATFAYDVKIARVQKTLRWLEEDASHLPGRLKDLSLERQRQAKSFAATMIHNTRTELERLIGERDQQTKEMEFPCEPAD